MPSGVIISENHRLNRNSYGYRNSYAIGVNLSTREIFQNFNCNFLYCHLINIQCAIALETVILPEM